MKSTELGAFEEIVLIVIAILGDNAYGVTIKNEIEKRTRNRPSIGALHGALYRLEKKGFVDSIEKGATSKRGGRRKRFYAINNLGTQKLMNAQRLRNELLSLIPGWEG